MNHHQPNEHAPCPFCGCENIDPTGWMSAHDEGPECDECGATAPSFEAWNRRAAPASGPAVDRDSVLEEAAAACEALESDLFDQYKGRGKHEPFNPARGDGAVNGQSDGAGQCAAAIRALKSIDCPVCGNHGVCGSCDEWIAQASVTPTAPEPSAPAMLKPLRTAEDQSSGNSGQLDKKLAKQGNIDPVLANSSNNSSSSNSSEFDGIGVQGAQASPWKWEQFEDWLAAPLEGKPANQIEYVRAAFNAGRAPAAVGLLVEEAKKMEGDGE